MRNNALLGGCYNFSYLTPISPSILYLPNIETGEAGQGLYDYVVAESSLDMYARGRLGAIGWGIIGTKT
ncbi:MAG: hypothetical protein IPO64_13025 [Bacteroidetes bacterium]|nr:hypothetical protein [Bacteroidota bacterium]